MFLYKYFTFRKKNIFNFRSMDKFPVKWNISVIPILSILLNINIFFKKGTEGKFHHIWNLLHCIALPATTLIILNFFIYKKLKTMTDSNDYTKQTVIPLMKAILKAKISIWISVIFIIASLFYGIPLIYWVSSKKYTYFIIKIT